jgi:hypothetical protein
MGGDQSDRERGHSLMDKEDHRLNRTILFVIDCKPAHHYHLFPDFHSESDAIIIRYNMDKCGSSGQKLTV